MKFNKTQYFLLFHAIITIITLGFYLYVYAPIQLYITNYTEFWFELAPVLFSALLLFVIFVFLILCISLLIINRNIVAGQIFIFVIFSVLLSFFIQGFLFSSDIPPFDGSTIDATNTVGIMHSYFAFVGIPIILSFVFLLIHREKFLSLTRIFSWGILSFLIITNTSHL